MPINNYFTARGPALKKEIGEQNAVLNCKGLITASSVKTGLWKMFNRKKVFKMCKQPKDTLKMGIAIQKEKYGCHTCIGKWRQSKIFNQVFYTNTKN